MKTLNFYNVVSVPQKAKSIHLNASNAIDIAKHIEKEFKEVQVLYHPSSGGLYINGKPVPVGTWIILHENKTITFISDEMYKKKYKNDSGVITLK